MMGSHVVKYCYRSVHFYLLGTLYDGEKFQLEFKFGSKYPFESPEVLKELMFCFSSCFLLLKAQRPVVCIMG